MGPNNEEEEEEDAVLFFKPFSKNICILLQQVPVLGSLPPGKLIISKGLVSNIDSTEQGS